MSTTTDNVTTTQTPADYPIAPCPFCGIQAPWCIKDDDGSEGWVECGMCHATGPRAKPYQLAVHWWNRRKPPFCANDEPGRRETEQMISITEELRAELEEVKIERDRLRSFVAAHANQT